MKSQLRADWSKLTDKQKRLIKTYMRTGNKVGSYKEVYDVDVSRSSTITNCYNEFKKPHIKAVIDQIQEHAVRESSISIDDIVQQSVDDLVEAQREVEVLKIDGFWILQRAAMLANFNIKKFLSVDGQGKAVYDFREATDDDWYCISEYTVDEISRGSGDDIYDVERVKIKSFDKIRALELVARFIPDANKEDDPIKRLAETFKQAFDTPSKIDVDATV